MVFCSAGWLASGGASRDNLQKKYKIGNGHFTFNDGNPDIMGI